MTSKDYPERMFRAYVECALWVETHGETDESFESAGYGPDDLSTEAFDRMRADVADFYAANRDDLDAFWSPEQAGHDLWLTRNRHGAGFWDRYAGGSEGYTVGRRLTDAAHACGECWAYLSDVGEVEVSC